MSVQSSPNEEQRTAIDFLQGPLRIIAGAGTGKTRTLTWRIEELIRQGLASPSQIVALTFTEKAANELRGRIDSTTKAMRIGPERVRVRTYHAFGAEIVREFGHLIGLPPDPKLLTQSEQWILLWRSLREIDFGFIELGYLKSPRPGVSEVSKMLQLNSRLADELRTVDDLRDFVLDLPEESDDCGRFQDYAMALAEYQEEKKRVGAIDYGDQIALAVRLLEMPEVAWELQKRYRYFLVDEYQDTNYAQSRMIELLAASNEPNICVVGDPLQAIYLFRGASPDNLERFGNVFETAKSLPLSENYRSFQFILDFANAIKLAGRTVGNLVSAKGEPGLQPRWVDLPGRNAEKQWVADEIDRYIRTGEAKPGEIMVLAKSNRLKLEFWQALDERGIPAAPVGGDSIFGIPAVQEAISWLRIVANPNDNAAFLQALTGDRWGLDESQIYQIGLPDGGRNPLAQRVLNLIQTVGGPPAYGDFWNELQRLTDLSYRITLAKLTEEIIGLRRGAQTVEEGRALRTFHRLVEQFSTSRFGRPTLPDLVEYLDLLEDAGGDDIEVDVPEEEAPDAVQVMTVHRAKGLQSKVVFVVGARDRGYRIARSNDLLPPALAHSSPGMPELDRERITADSYKDYSGKANDWRRQLAAAETERVFYVAATRAEERLILTASLKEGADGSGNNNPLPVFLEAARDRCKLLTPGENEITRQGPLKPVIAELVKPLQRELGPEEDLATALADRWVSAGGSLVALQEAMVLAETKKQFVVEDQAAIEQIERRRAASVEEQLSNNRRSYSYSSLNDFQQCPHRYHLRYRLGLRGKPSPRSTAVGTAVHAVIELDGQRRRDGLSGLASDALREQMSVLITQESGGEEYKADTTAILENYLNSPDQSAEILLTEAPFVLRLGQHLLVGTIDRVQRAADGTTEVVDFKTDRRTRSQEEVRNGLQLPIYLLAVREAFPEIQPPPSRGVMFFLRSNQRVVVEYSDSELQAFWGKLETLMGSAEAVDPESHHASPETCRYCEYREFCRFSQAETQPAFTQASG